MYDTSAVFGELDALVTAGKLRYYGVSVETCDEAMKAIRHPHVQSVQIIFNLFRMKPAEAFLNEALAQRVGVIARVPLASGLLTGKLTVDVPFRGRRPSAVQSPRRAVRSGRDVFRRALRRGARRRSRTCGRSCRRAATMAQFALRWILMHDAVTCVIPGAKTPAQARENISAA